MRKKKNIELPFSFPMLATFHNTALVGIISNNDPNAKIQMFNQCTSLSCSKKFLGGYSTPEMGFAHSWLFNYGNLDIIKVSMQFAYKCHRDIARAMLEEGRYVYFNNIDDYYIPNKSWYNERHMLHDGIICGCDDSDDTYSVAAYDKNWVFRLFKVKRKFFDEAIEKSFAMGMPAFFGCKSKGETVELDIVKIAKDMQTYVNSDLSIYPNNGDTESYVSGAAVNDYIAIYIDKLLDESIPYEKMDWRVVRVIWEFRACMLERIKALENKLAIDDNSSEAYRDIVLKTDRLRMMYAVCHKKRNDQALISVRDGLKELVKKEREILAAFVTVMEGKI